MAQDIDAKKLTSDIINAVAPHVIKGSATLVSYEGIHAKLLAEFTAAIADDINNNRITDAEARNLMRMQETVEATHMLAKDVIKDSTTSKAVLALMKVVQGAFNTATGLSIGIF